jgi:hypothetical protein
MIRKILSMDQSDPMRILKGEGESQFVFFISNCNEIKINWQYRIRIRSFHRSSRSLVIILSFEDSTLRTDYEWIRKH